MSRQFSMMLRMSCICGAVTLLLGAADATLNSPAAGSQFTLYSTFGVDADVDTDNAIAVVANKPMGTGILFVDSTEAGGNTQWFKSVPNVRMENISGTAQPGCYWLPGKGVFVGGGVMVLQQGVLVKDMVRVDFNFSNPFPPMP